MNLQTLWQKLRPHLIKERPTNTVVYLVNEKGEGDGRLIAFMMKDSYPVPLTDENLNRLRTQLLRQGVIPLNDMPYVRYARPGEMRDFHAD